MKNKPPAWIDDEVAVRDQLWAHLRDDMAKIEAMALCGKPVFPNLAVACICAVAADLVLGDRLSVSIERSEEPSDEA